MKTNISVLPITTKRCTKCGETKEMSAFYKCKANPDGFKYNCIDCCNITRRIHRENNHTKFREYEKARFEKDKDKIYAQRKTNYWNNIEEKRAKRRQYISRGDYDKQFHAKLLHYNIKKRCKKDGVVFDIKPTDIVIPEYCPALGFKLVRGRGFDAASVDRIIPELGYIKSNIVVVSRLANMMKNAGTVEQMMSVALFYKNLMESRNE